MVLIWLSSRIIPLSLRPCAEALGSARTAGLTPLGRSLRRRSLRRGTIPLVVDVGHRVVKDHQNAIRLLSPLARPFAHLFHERLGASRLKWFLRPNRLYGHILRSLLDVLQFSPNLDLVDDGHDRRVHRAILGDLRLAG